MAKCARCGIGGLGLIRTGYRFSDGKYVCVPCALDLGFKKSGIKNPCIYYRYDEVQDGLAAYHNKQHQDAVERRSARMDISPAQYEALDNANATEFEFKMFARICALLDDEGVDSTPLQVALGQNGSLFIINNGKALIEYKGEPDIKWIRLADDPDNKIRFGQLGKLNSLADRIVTLFR